MGIPFANAITPAKEYRSNEQISTHFNASEFNKAGLKAWYIHPSLVAGLEALRRLLGRPIIITSGYRSPAQNAKAGGASASQHLNGMGADIKVPGLSTVEVARAAAGLFGGLGYASDHLHVDIGRVRHWFEDGTRNFQFQAIAENRDTTAPASPLDPGAGFFTRWWRNLGTVSQKYVWAPVANTAGAVVGATEIAKALTDPANAGKLGAVTVGLLGLLGVVAVKGVTR